MRNRGSGSGTTALLFLGTCLAFAESTLAFMAQRTTSSELLIALFALAALGLVLTTLAFMYWRNPGFLTIEGRQASELAIIQTVAATRPEAITPAFLLSLSSRDLAQGVATNVDEGLEESEAAEESLEFQEEFRRLAQAQKSEEK